MKIKITEEQNKKLFLPRNIIERQKEFLKIIGMGPVIQYMKDNDTSIHFDMDTSFSEWSWHIHDISDGNGNYLENFEKPFRKLFESIGEEIMGVTRMYGEMSITDDNKLFIGLGYEFTNEGGKDITYQL